MKSKIQFDNEALKTALLTYKDDIRHMDDGVSLSDAEAQRVARFRSLGDVEKSIYYLYVMHGGTEAADLLGVSRQFVYKKIREVNRILG